MCSCLVHRSWRLQVGRKQVPCAFKALPHLGLDDLSQGHHELLLVWKYLWCILRHKDKLWGSGRWCGSRRAAATHLLIHPRRCEGLHICVQHLTWRARLPTVASEGVIQAPVPLATQAFIVRSGGQAGSHGRRFTTSRLSAGWIAHRPDPEPSAPQL